MPGWFVEVHYISLYSGIMGKTMYLMTAAMILMAVACSSPDIQEHTGPLKISENGRFFTDQNGEPFFWLGDTGWLLFGKLDREAAVRYLEDRRQKGFNVIQVMLLHDPGMTSVYGDSALVNRNVARPKVTGGSSFEENEEYDYWDHVDFIIDRADEKGICMALVPVWGSHVRSGHVSRKAIRAYGEFLAERYNHRKNIIWLNGGDVRGSDSTAIWSILGHTLKERCPDHLITFHPFGRTQSSTWFHNDPWLDFNMFQSGHKRYDQDTSGLAYGEDNWRYAGEDYGLYPVKPTLDGEPSYEGIPQGLHDPSQPFWTDKDVRRYAYWSVFAGSAGHTYGHSAIMQMHRPGDENPGYGNTVYWTDALDAPGAGQLIHLKNLMLSRPYFERIPDQSLIADQGERYDYLSATRSTGYAFVYTYTGRNFTVDPGPLAGTELHASWFNPRDGSTTGIGTFPNRGLLEFDPPGERGEGNDWVLILDAL